MSVFSNQLVLARTKWSIFALPRVFPFCFFCQNEEILCMSLYLFLSYKKRKEKHEIRLSSTIYNTILETMLRKLLLNSNYKNVSTA